MFNLLSKYKTLNLNLDAYVELFESLVLCFYIALTYEVCCTVVSKV